MCLEKNHIKGQKDNREVGIRPAVNLDYLDMAKGKPRGGKCYAQHNVKQLSPTFVPKGLFGNKSALC